MFIRRWETMTVKSKIVRAHSEKNNGFESLSYTSKKVCHSSLCFQLFDCNERITYFCLHDTYLYTVTLSRHALCKPTRHSFPPEIKYVVNTPRPLPLWNLAGTSEGSLGLLRLSCITSSGQPSIWLGVCCPNPEPWILGVSQGPAQRLRVGVVAEVRMGKVELGGGGQLLNTTEEGPSGCVFYSWLVLEGIKPHSQRWEAGSPASRWIL